MRARLFVVILTALLGQVMHIPRVFAAAPDLINYQGVLKDVGGVPLSGTFSVTFAIWSIPIGGLLFWSEEVPGLATAALQGPE